MTCQPGGFFEILRWSRYHRRRSRAEQGSVMQKIFHESELLALIWRDEDWRDGLHFPTPEEFFLQVGLWQYPADKELPAHRHKRNPRTAEWTQEATYVKRGRMEVKVFNTASQLVEAVILNEGDLAVMVSGGHSYKILEENTQVLEFKNGPFLGVESDKENLF
jgi:hypothetical protein